MPKELERDLGLYAVLTISIGAMVGSGIFVLPGKAAGIAGPAVVLAYLLAGVLVLPAALSKAEMATAMPESGGTYLYIDRAMGPQMGTIAGLGAWFSLVFKSAFALVGLGAYLVLFAQVPAVPVALALAVALVGVNLVGVKQTGRLQAVVVTVVLVALVAFIADGITYVESARYHPFSPNGTFGVFEAAGFVFVSYAGVTKIASVAEEVEDPGRNLPLGMLGSIGLMMLVYTFVVFVVVGTTPADLLVDTNTPMAAAATNFFGGPGRFVIAGVAVLALTSMANAGILSSSRFPLAMSRDDLAPPSLGSVGERFRTPWAAILSTGALLVVLVAFVDVLQLAKLASAFQILVFVFVNAALVSFREAELDWYQPSFRSPAYPWVQLVGILGGIVLLAFMGPLPLLGAVGIVLGGLVWYRLYGRAKTDREGAALDALRRSEVDRALERTRAACADERPKEVLIPVGREPTAEERADFLSLVRLGTDLAGASGGRVRVVSFQEVPHQLDLEAATEQPLGEVDFEPDSGMLLDADVAVDYGEVVTHDAKRAVASFVDHYGVDVVLGEWHPSRWHAELLGADVDWYMRHTTTDFVFVRNRGYGEVDEITVIADEGPFDPLEVVVADAIAAASDATIKFVTTVREGASDEQFETAWAYLDDLAEFCRAESDVVVTRTDDQVDGLVGAARSSDVALIGTSAHNLVYDVLFGTVPDRIVERLDGTVLLAHSGRPRRHTFLRAVIDRLLY